MQRAEELVYVHPEAEAFDGVATDSASYEIESESASGHKTRRVVFLLQRSDLKRGLKALEQLIDS